MLLLNTLSSPIYKVGLERLSSQIPLQLTGAILDFLNAHIFWPEFQTASRSSYIQCASDSLAGYCTWACVTVLSLACLSHLSTASWTIFLANWLSRKHFFSVGGSSSKWTYFCKHHKNLQIFSGYLNKKLASKLLIHCSYQLLCLFSIRSS